MKWFPQIKDMINIERLCRAAGFNKEQTATLLTGKPIEYNGEFYSEEHKRTTASSSLRLTCDPSANDSGSSPRNCGRAYDNPLYRNGKVME